MSISPDELDALLSSEETEHLEFKEAKESFSEEKLLKYCSALANEGGGRLVLGVSFRVPRIVGGTSAFRNLAELKGKLLTALRLRIEVTELQHPAGRVLVFEVPPRPVGMPIPVDGAYWMRAGGSLVAMTPDRLKQIFDEATPDFSASVCPGAQLGDLDQAAIQSFREKWAKKSGRTDLLQMSDEQLLSDAGLVEEGGVTHAALVLFGNPQALRRFLPQAELIFEYRSNDAALEYQARTEFRQGFFAFDDKLLTTINLRNDLQHFQDGFFVWDVPTFNERVVREGILNAVSHRDYRLAGSIFVRQFPHKLEIVSPGGFPEGVTPENILRRQKARNLRIAEALAKCGLVERSGQGADLMFRESIRESKPRPDYSDTDEHQVSLTLRGEVQDPGFLRFLERVGEQKLRSFSVEDMLVLDMLRAGDAIPERLRARLQPLRELGLVEAIGHGRGARYFLAKKLYVVIGDRAGYTKKRGLDRETNKALLLKHLEHYKTEGSQLRDLMRVLPSLSRGQVQSLMRDLRREGRAHAVGVTSAGRWYVGKPGGELASERKPSTGSN